MIPLENENNPLILRELAKALLADNKRLREILEKQNQEQSQKDQQYFSMDESLQVLRKKFFGASSEKSDRPRNRNNTDPEVLLHSQNILSTPKNKTLKDLPEIIELVEATDNELIEMSTSLGLSDPGSGQWEKIPNMFEVSSVITVTERIYTKKKIKRQKYRLKSKFESGKSQFYTAESSHGLLPGSSYSGEFAASVVVDKYVNHLPLERQARMMESLGLYGVKTQTLYNLARVVGEYFNPVAEKIKNEILSCKAIHSDETPWPITNGKDSNGYMWVLSNSLGSYYSFEPGRSGAAVEQRLKTFNGVLMTDAFSGYNRFRNLERIKLVHCHAHARREFYDIKDNYPEIEEYLKLYKELFSIEHLGHNNEVLNELRQNRSKLIIEKMKSWLLENHPKSRPQSKLRGAIEYSLKHWKELTHFVDDPSVPLTNNEAERTIRQAVMGRKNFYGSRSIDGADLAATMYTVIESCKKVELDPRTYICNNLLNLIRGESVPTPFEHAKSLRDNNAIY
jgi:hypothetical protein